jgi:hypothetical protein
MANLLVLAGRGRQQTSKQFLLGDSVILSASAQHHDGVLAVSKHQIASSMVDRRYFLRWNGWSNVSQQELVQGDFFRKAGWSRNWPATTPHLLTLD